jgi:hypothetical protein
VVAHLHRYVQCQMVVSQDFGSLQLQAQQVSGLFYHVMAEAQVCQYLPVSKYIPPIITMRFDLGHFLLIAVDQLGDCLQVIV